MAVVLYNNKLCIASIKENDEDQGSVSYDRLVEFYDYEKLEKLDGATLTEEALKRCLYRTEWITGTSLPYEHVYNYPPIQLHAKKLYEVQVAKTRQVTEYIYEYNYE